jgi:AcrR family transcriptional regulator
MRELSLTVIGGVTNKEGVATRSPRRGGKRRDPEKTRARILKAATDLFTRCGLNGASLDDISRKAGVNRGLIYHYFKTKEMLFDQVLARPLASYIQSHLEFLQRRDLDVEALREATAQFFRFLSAHPDLVRLLGWTLAMRRVAVDLAQLELSKALFSRAVERIEDAKQRGAFRRDLDATHLLITIIDLSVAWHLGRAEWIEKLSWSDRDTRALDEERLAAILDLLTAAVTPRARAGA